MSVRDKVKWIPRERKSDDRGWFLKLINGREEFLPAGPVEVYAVSATPGSVRGNHYHKDTAEWFCVVQGRGEVALVDVATGERHETAVDFANPRTIFVPAGIAHAFRNPPSEASSLVIVAVASRFYDPNDTIAFPVYTVSSVEK